MELSLKLRREEKIHPFIIIATDSTEKCRPYKINHYKPTMQFSEISFVSQTYSHDDCFNGIHLPRLSSIPAVEHDVWRWHALERRFNVGTKCTFRAVIKNVWSEETSKLYSSCIVGEDGEFVNQKKFLINIY